MRHVTVTAFKLCGALQAHLDCAMWRCTHLYTTTHDTDRRPKAFSADYVPPHFYAMSVSPPLPSSDQREAAIPDRGLLASVAFLVVLGPLIADNWFLDSL